MNIKDKAFHHLVSFLLHIFSLVDEMIDQVSQRIILNIVRFKDTFKLGTSLGSSTRAFHHLLASYVFVTYLFISYVDEAI